MSEILHTKLQESATSTVSKSKVKGDNAISIEISKDKVENSDVVSVLNDIIATSKARGAKKIKIELEF